MKILILGASGLIGRHLIPLLIRDHNVIIPQRQFSKLNDIVIDLEDNWSVHVLPKQIDSVIYLAQSEKFRNFPEFAESVFRVNTLSLLKALDYARCAGARTFVYASSGGIYGNSTQVCDEDTPIGSGGELGFYLGTKLCGEIIAENYIPYMNVIILRPFFVYGPGQRKDMLIPRLVERVRNGQPIQLIGEDGLQINPTYVEDAALAIRQALSLETAVNQHCRSGVSPCAGLVS